MSPRLERLRNIVARLRSPDGCPWDLEQTHRSLKPHLIEECYELIDAINAGEDEGMKEELGDILLQVVLHSQIASEEGRFDLDDVATAIADKLVARHPHVFGETRLPDSAAVLQQWERLKRTEKQERRSAERRSALDGVPKWLPALARAQKVQTKAAGVGFDWSDAEGALAKVREELAEVETASAQRLEEEIGDLLFAVVNFARKKGLDAEGLLLQSTAKFVFRFTAMERLAKDRGLDLIALGLREMDELWEEAKNLQRDRPAEEEESTG
jgi:MazG family protein